jgi:hypothetical protein
VPEGPVAPEDPVAPGRSVGVATGRTQSRFFRRDVDENGEVTHRML